MYTELSGRGDLPLAKSLDSLIRDTRLQADDIPISISISLPNYLLRAFFETCTILARSRSSCLQDAIHAWCLDNDNDPADYRMESKVPEVKLYQWREEVRNTKLPQVLQGLLESGKVEGGRIVELQERLRLLKKAGAVTGNDSGR